MNRCYLGGVALLFCVLLAAAQGEGKGYLATFDVSPDGERIVFSATGQGLTDLYLLTLKSGQVQRLTRSDLCEMNPRFSPDGRWIVYSGNPKSTLTSHIYLRSLDGKVVRQLTATDGVLDFMLVFSPDGSTIAFSRVMGMNVKPPQSGLGDVYTVHTDGGELRWITKQDYETRPDPAFSPDGHSLLYIGRKGGVTDIYKVGSRGQSPPQPLLNRRLLSAASPVLDGWELQCLLDGKQVLFTTTTNGDNSSSGLYLMNVDGTQAKRLTLGQDTLKSPRYYPGSRLIYFLNESETTGRCSL